MKGVGDIMILVYGLILLDWGWEHKAEVNRRICTYFVVIKTGEEKELITDISLV